MRYYLTVNSHISREVSTNLWKTIRHTGTNMMILPDKAYIYGDNSEVVIEMIIEKVENAGFVVERG